MSIKSQYGFTLIEMMIVVVIIAIIASIALPAYQNYILKAKIQGAQSDLVGLALSAESNYQRQLSYPTTTSITSTSTPSLSSTFPTWNPSSKDFTYSYSGSSTGLTYTLTGTANSNSPANGCVLTLTNTSAKTISTCGTFTQWIN